MFNDSLVAIIVAIVSPVLLELMTQESALKTIVARRTPFLLP